ncbi:MAG TPA: hypothetical protein VKZ18_02865 [Polyangia bacterium]|nr:hypothetical protein [Polyangia bacterium]
MPPTPQAAALPTVEIISADTEVLKNVELAVDVLVTGAPAEAAVTARLAEVTGIPIVIDPSPQTKTAGANGVLTFSFRVTVKRAGAAVLEASANDAKETAYPAATLVIEALDDGAAAGP